MCARGRILVSLVVVVVCVFPRVLFVSCFPLLPSLPWCWPSGERPVAPSPSAQLGRGAQ